MHYPGSHRRLGHCSPRAKPYSYSRLRKYCAMASLLRAARMANFKVFAYSAVLKREYGLGKIPLRPRRGRPISPILWHIQKLLYVFVLRN